MRIGIDLMGNDNSPDLYFEAVRQAANLLDESVSLVVFATKEIIDKTSLPPASKAKIIFHEVSDVISMCDDPLFAIRHKKGSSLVQGIKLLKKKQLDAFVTGGNTGALIACATLSLPMMAGIRRPALLTLVPSRKGHLAVLDVGGSVSCKAQHYVQFASMGAAYWKWHTRTDTAKVGLLNIGTESKKGTSELREAYQILKTASQFTFIGNVEGREVFQGAVDVLVTDGFTGNILLKSAEGIASFIFEYLKHEPHLGQSESLMQSIQVLQKAFNYSEYPGAVLCGVDRVVLKCHGNSSSKEVFNSIMESVKLLNTAFLETAREYLKG